jgi:hypothetical protein
MRIATLLALSILVALLTAGCGEHSSSEKSAPPFKMLTLERTECFGTCPAYKVTVTSGGLVTFTGTNHTFRKEASSQLSSVDLLALRGVIASVKTRSATGRLGVKQPCERYVTDNAGLNIQVDANGQITAWNVYHGCEDSEYLRLVEWVAGSIDTLTGTAPWIFGLQPGGPLWIRPVAQ